MKPLHVADMHGEKASSEELLLIEFTARKTGFGAILDIQRRFFGIRFIAMNDNAWSNIEPNAFRGLVRCIKIDGFHAWVDSVDRGMVDHIFISQVAGDMIAPQFKRPLIDCVSNRQADIKVGINQFGRTGVSG